MWQRDFATGRFGWAVWLGVALALHTGLLVAAKSWRATAFRAVELVRVSLLPAGEPKGSDGPTGGGQPPPPAPAVPEPVLAKPALPVQNKPAPVKPRLSRPKLKRSPDSDKPKAPEAPAPESASSGAAEGDVGSATAGGSGMGSGSGRGDGVGKGVGGGGGGFGAGGDQRGFCVYCPEPGYPMIARRRGWSGKVDVELVLLADGRVESADVMRSSGYDVLDREAVDVARRSRFRLPNPTAAPVRGHIEYRFELTQ